MVNSEKNWSFSLLCPTIEYFTLTDFDFKGKKIVFDNSDSISTVSLKLW